MKKNLLIILISLCSIHCSFAQKDTTQAKSKSYKSFIVPASLLTIGFVTRFDIPFNKYKIRKLRNEKFADFDTELDDYLQFAPIGFAYGLGVFQNMKSKSDFVNKTVLLVKSELIMAMMVYPLKYIVADKRPDGSADNAWPSGHTTQAFVAAAFLDHEYRHKSIWISIAAYSCAATVGTMRILNNRHWSADVFAGAGIGVLATNIAYLTHQYKWKNFKFLENKKVSILPYYQNKGGGIVFSLGL